jgi:hypothetical protein
MRKSTIFISVVLSTFALVMLYGVVDAYRSSSNVPPVTPQAINTALPEPIIEPTVSPMLTPEEAAQLAAAVVGQANLLSAESSTFNELQAYKITFTNNDVVYVGLDGQILSVQVAPVVVNVIQPVQARLNNNNVSGGGEDHSSEDHEEHEDEHDD